MFNLDGVFGGEFWNESYSSCRPILSLDRFFFIPWKLFDLREIERECILLAKADILRLIESFLLATKTDCML